MESPLLIALSKADVLSRQMDLVANNIANATTVGFKQQSMLFQTQMSQPEPGQQLDFVIDRATYRDMSAGPIMQTGNPLDVALNGPGFLAVKNTDGNTVYTRAGALKLSPDGNIVDALGNTVQSDGGDALNIPDTATNVAIGEDGTVSSDQGVLGKLQVSEFSSPQQLQPVGNGYFKADNIQPTAASETSVVSGSLENSNVQPVLQMTEMMDITRQYEMTQNIISQEHDRIRNAIKTLGKVA